MKYRCGFYLLGLAVLIGLTGCVSSSEKIAKDSDTAAKPLRLRLMTYNIRIGIGGGDWDGNPAKINLAPAARIISAQHVDLAGLQEVDRFRKRSGGLNEPKWLSEILSMKAAFEPAYSTPTSDGVNEDYGVALLTPHWVHNFERFLLFKPDYSKSHPEYPDYYSEQRVLLHALVSVRSRDLHVFVTHLGLTADQRAKQVQEIIAIMARYAGPKILLGDFNAEPTAPEMAPLFGNYRDALAEAGVKNHDRKTFPVGNQSKEAIDHIFLSREFQVREAKVIRDSTLASDHNPVFAEVELP